MSAQAIRSHIWDDVETLPQQEMEEFQTERLRAGIDRVSKTVPFYREKLGKAERVVDKRTL